MAYNPFDDVIDQDPAYMQTGGGTPTTDQKPNVLQSALKPVQKVGEFFEPGLMYAGEAMMNAPYQFGKLLDTDKTTKERYQETMQDPKSFVQGLKTFMIPIEALGEGLTYLFNPQDIRETRLKLASGEAEPVERIAAQIGATFELLGAGELFKIIGRKFGPDIVSSLQKQNLQSPQEIINALPVSGKEKVEFAKEVYGGMGLPSKPPGMETSQVMMDVADRPGIGTGQAFKEGIPYDVFLKGTIKNDSEDFVKLAEILNKTPIDELDKTITQIARENNLNTLFKIEKRKDKKDKKIVKQYVSPALARYNLVPEEKLNKLKNISKSQSYKSTQPEIINSLQKFKEEGKVFETAVDIAAELGLTKGSFENMTYRNPEIKKLKDSIVLTTPKGTLALTTQDKFFRDTANIFANKQKFVDLYKDMQNSGGVKIIDEINALKRQADVGNEVTTFRLFQNYMYDKFRSVKGTKGNEGLSASKFVDKYMDDSDLDNFKKYAELELERNKANVLSRTALEELYQLNPQYRPYLLNDKGKLDITLLQYDKAHDIPMFVTRKEGKGRLQTKGRFVGAGSEVELIQPNLQTYNNLQRRVDPNLNFFADVLNNKTLEKKFKEKPAKITKNRQPTLENPITQRLINTLDEYGYKPDVSKFDNQFDFIKEVTQFIDTTYKDRKIRSVVPIRTKGSLKDNAIFGIEEPQLLDPMQKVQSNVERLKEIIDYNIANNISPKDSKVGGYLKGFKKGGAVKMAKGGLDSVLENMNQQNFTPDPAIDGDSAFQQAVKSGNLTAFNIPKVFKTLGDTFGVFTPKRASAPTATTAEGVDAGTALGAPPGQTLPATKPLQSEDFVFESFTLDKINSPTAPKAAKPQDWINYLQGGKDKAPSAELLDSGLFQYMADFEKFFPNQKMTKQQIVELYEQSPIANLKIKIKTDRDGMTPYGPDEQQAMGIAKHKNAGNARIDAGGTDYREIVLEAGALPGQKTSFVNSTHFNEPNVLVFSRVANYDNKAGEQVAVIQELQTDLLTKVRKEQERLNSIIENKKAQVERNNNILQDPNRDNYDRAMATENLTRLVPELNQLEKVKETNLISPYPMTVAKDLIPTYQKQLNDVQQQINTLMRAGIDRSDPEFLMKISELEAQQQKVLDDLLNLNRTSNFEELTKGIRVPASGDSEQLANIAQGRDNYASMKDLETFPPIPFNKQPDYVDLIIKATIKDAEARGINKVAIMPADVGANPRWGKTTLQMDREDKSSGDKFRNLYDKVGVQQLKNIAKKYGGQLNIEEIIDPQKSNLGLTFSTRNIEGDGFNFMKELDVDQNAISRGDLGPANQFLNEEILRVAQEMGPNEVVYRKETAPGQTMDYFVQVKQTDVGDNFDLVPLKAGDDALDARILIEDRDPSAVKMYTITLPEKTKDKPFFLFRKKEGGKIPGDRLVSITDIYGDY